MIRSSTGRVVVTDGDNRVALAAVRALGAAGLPVHVSGARTSRGGRPAAATSRHCRGWIETGDDRDFERALRAGDVLLPISTQSVLWAAERRDALSGRGVRLLVPPVEIVRSAIRKDELARTVGSAAIPIPRTIACAAEEVASRRVELPCPFVLKLRDDEGLDVPPAARYRIVRRPEDAPGVARELGRRHPRLVAQEYLSGEGGGVTGVAWKGDLRGAVGHRRIRELPPTGGPSACAETTDDPELLQLARRTVAVLRWEGPVMIEAKRRTDGGAWTLLEVNPRFGGSLPLALAAGVNLPELVVRLASGQAVAPPRSARAGVRMRFLPMDIQAVLLALAMGVRRGRYVASFLRDSLDGTVKEGLLDCGDPAPGRAFLARGIRSAAAGLFPRSGER